MEAKKYNQIIPTPSNNKKSHEPFPSWKGLHGCNSNYHMKLCKLTDSYQLQFADKAYRNRWPWNSTLHRYISPSRKQCDYL